MKTLSDNDKAVLNSIFNPLLPLGEGIYAEDSQDVLEDDESIRGSPEMKQIEKKGVLKAEEGNLEDAIDIFNHVIQESNNIASAYNNRAQVYRLLNKDKEAMEDLNKSLEISQRKGRSGCNSLCQRGLLYRKFSQNELAKKDFEEASLLGSLFAKQQLVEMNPYAAMCNQMLSNMMAKLRQTDIEN